jgi:hypothetical protein
MFGPTFSYRGRASRPLHVILFTFEDINSAVEFVSQRIAYSGGLLVFLVGAFLNMREVIFSSRFPNEGLVSREIKPAAKSVSGMIAKLCSAELYPASAPPTTAWKLVDDFGGAEDDAFTPRSGSTLLPGKGVI